jgi:hypothetical protein
MESSVLKNQNIIRPRIQFSYIDQSCPFVYSAQEESKRNIWELSHIYGGLAVWEITLLHP